MSFGKSKRYNEKSLKSCYCNYCKIQDNSTLARERAYTGWIIARMRVELSHPDCNLKLESKHEPKFETWILFLQTMSNEVAFGHELFVFVRVVTMHWTENRLQKACFGTLAYRSTRSRPESIKTPKKSLNQKFVSKTEGWQNFRMWSRSSIWSLSQNLWDCNWLNR